MPLRALLRSSGKLYMTTQEIPSDRDSPNLPSSPFAEPVASFLRSRLVPLRIRELGHLVLYSVNCWLGSGSTGNRTGSTGNTGSTGSTDSGNRTGSTGSGSTGSTKTNTDTDNTNTNTGADGPLRPTSTGLHVDYHDNLYVLLRGRKRFTIYGPWEARRMATVGSVAKVHGNGLINFQEVRCCLFVVVAVAVVELDKKKKKIQHKKNPTPLSDWNDAGRRRRWLRRAALADALRRGRCFSRRSGLRGGGR
jgi:hypothetical protein